MGFSVQKWTEFSLWKTPALAQQNDNCSHRKSQLLINSFYNSNLRCVSCRKVALHGVREIRE